MVSQKKMLKPWDLTRFYRPIDSRALAEGGSRRNRSFQCQQIQILVLSDSPNYFLTTRCRPNKYPPGSRINHNNLYNVKRGASKSETCFDWFWLRTSYHLFPAKNRDPQCLNQEMYGTIEPDFSCNTNPHDQSWSKGVATQHHPASQIWRIHDQKNISRKTKGCSP